MRDAGGDQSLRPHAHGSDFLNLRRRSRKPLGENPRIQIIRQPDEIPNPTQ
ncbi:MAG: hypothetical protein BroJett003_11020 [Planctomycetota bacterium]|nr:MAG: hypothetical protein BroJett003_11020 [Planctomycetota bacterium]